MKYLSTLTTPAAFRLAAYVVAAVVGLYMVVTGRADAASAEQWVASAQTQLGALLTIVGSLAGINIDPAQRPKVETVDLPTAREAMEGVVRDHLDGLRGAAENAIDTAETAIQVTDPGAALAKVEELKARIAAVQRGVDPR